MKSQRELVEKAMITVSDLTSNGGYLNPMQANTFIRMLIDQPTLIKEIRTVPMNAPKMEINKIGFGSRILRVAPASGTALGATDRAKPTTDQVELTTSEVIAEVHIPYDVLEDNIERGRLEDTIMALIAERASSDLEELLIRGNTGSSDAYLAMKNGLLQKASSHVVDYSATAPNISKGIFKAGIKAMPAKYRKAKKNMRFYVSDDAEVEWRDSLADRQTPLGDRKIVSANPEPAYSVPVIPCSYMYDHSAIFTYPKNIIWGVQRQIMIETDRDIRTRVIIVVVTLRIDFQYEEEDAVVKITGLDPNDLTSTTA